MVAMLLIDAKKTILKSKNIFFEKCRNLLLDFHPEEIVWIQLFIISAFFNNKKTNSLNACY